MALDKNNNGIGYLLGRLFALFEAESRGGRAYGLANEQKLGGSKVKLYADFCEHPALTLPVLMRAYSKGDRKLDAQVSEIFNMLKPEALPSRLSLEEQGSYAIGYHHQLHSMDSEAANA